MDKKEQEYIDKISKMTNKIVCPICRRPVAEISKINDRDNNISFWGECLCGIIFQLEKPSHKLYNKKYRNNYKVENYEAINSYGTKIYAPLLEELCDSRKFLEVGFNLPCTLDFMESRGWVCYGIDINKDKIEERPRIFKGNFEDYDFGDHKFNLIWMGHVFEHFDNPIKVIMKCYDLLSESGVLFISTPDIDFINTLGKSEWPHWNKNEHYIFWNMRSLSRELERLGFKVLMKRRNFSSRFSSWHDIHIIAQKIYF